MIVAVMGSQGSGKSTVLAELEKRGHNVVSRKTSRSILEEWGVTLSQVNNDRELTIRFQDEIRDRKIQDDMQHKIGSEEIWFTERTFADLFTYALIAVGKDNEFSDWLNEYYAACRYSQNCYDGIFYLKGGLFAVAADGVRGANQHYARMVDIVMEDITTGMNYDRTPLYKVDIVDLQARVDFIESTALRLQAEKRVRFSSERNTTS
jgi:predicted ATPase